jgi:phthiocerol/phenolphthiocerol synthesis type-I polyketide synthase E
MTETEASGLEPIAVIGMSCRVPGSANVRQFWQNLVAGVESVRIGTSAEHVAVGVPSDEAHDPEFVPVSAVLADPEGFDAAMFGMTPAEAELRDPQHRLFLELADTALQDSGYDPRRYRGDIGVYAGSGEDAYQWRNVRRNRAAAARAGVVGLAVNSHPDYVATLTSYQLGLRGPSLTVHTACSTSLVAVHLACEALRNGECDMALAGAANLELPLGHGYVYTEGGVNSRDGHCRAFDAAATGTVWGSGGGVVVLRRLQDAVAEGDDIRAVIVGNAINNDGSVKAGFTAPSQEGQAAVIAQALSAAGVDPRTIGFVEAHGTGTVLGDPIEVAALSSVYRRHTTDRGWCAIGSVKTNVGHLGSAAGVIGLIKAALAVRHGMIPPSLNYETANREIDFGDNPFFVNSEPSVWDDGDRIRRAAVSSFGMGGTNAHVILEQPAPRTSARARAGCHLIQLSARTQTALAATAAALADHLEAAEQARNQDLTDTAYTLRVGRRQLPERLAVVAASKAEAAKALRDRKRQILGSAGRDVPGVVFMFPGQGTQYAGMGADLYAAEPVYRDTVEECCSVLAAAGPDLRAVLSAGGRAETVDRTAVAQPALFIVAYALARLWQSRGVSPCAMVGHSIGEYVAATCAGVFELTDALRIVAARGELMQSMPVGAMIAVQLDEEELRGRLPEGAWVAAVNGPHACTVSGQVRVVRRLAETLGADGIRVRPLRTSRAFHSAMMDPVISAFRDVVATAELRPPRIPFASNVTGDWTTEAEAADPAYWARHIREPVRFGDCVTTVAAPGVLFLECGPGRQLSGLVRMRRSGHQSVPCLPGPGEPGDGARTLAEATGTLWTAGCELDAAATGARGNRVALPTYPWERQRHWILPDPDTATAGQQPGGEGMRPGARGELLVVPVWRQLTPAATRLPVRRALVLTGADDLVADELARHADDVVRVRRGTRFEHDGSGYRVRPDSREDYAALFTALAADGGIPDLIVHCWTMSDAPASSANAAWAAQDSGFFSALSLVQALAQTEVAGVVRLTVVTAGSYDVIGGDLARPEHATLAGAVAVLPREFPWLTARHIDVDPDFAAGPAAGTRRRRLTEAIVDEIRAASADGDFTGDSLVGLRNGRRWCRRFEEAAAARSAGDTTVVRDHGVYLITGGIGGIGITIAEDLAARFKATLVLTSREELPPRCQWDDPDVVAAASARARRAIAAIRRMEDAGARVHVIAADVASPAAVRTLRAEIASRCGELNGIVHAAGVAGGGMAEVRDRGAAEDVLRPKIAGTLALRDAFGDQPLDFVVLCSSVEAIAGGFGQVDYSAANAFLDAHAGGDHGWNARVVSVNWGAWSKVGMAAEVAMPPAFRALHRDQRVIPIRHGLLTEWHPADGDKPGWCSGTVSPATHWLLAEHRVAGVPALPGTAYLEVARCAFETCTAPPGPGHAVQLTDLAIGQPLTVPYGTSAELRVSLSPADDGTEFEVLSAADGVTRVHARGSAAWVPAQWQAADLGEIRKRCSRGVVSGESLAASGSGLVTVGPHWGNVVRVYQGAGEELAMLVATEALEPDPYPWTIQPAMMDQAVMAGWAGGRHGFLPFGYGKVVVLRELPETVWSHLRYRDAGTADMMTADLTLYDEAGAEVLRIEEFSLRKADVAAVTPAPVAASAASEPGKLSAAAGAAAFRRLVDFPLVSQVVVSATPIEEMIAASRRLDYAAVAASVPRPEAVGAFVPEGLPEPGSEREKAVARIFGELLGKPGIGADTDFFEAGGDSLVAVQLMAMVRKQFGVRLSMRRFFADSTVTGIAALIDELSSAVADDTRTT